MPRTSSRVQLEVAILDDDQAALAPAPSAALEERPRVTVLVVAAESDLRRYVRECLRERTDLRLLDAASVTAAVTLAAHELPDLFIVDEPERDVLVALSDVRAIVIVDDVPRDAPASGARLRQLARPFTGEGLLAEVGLLLG
jgi:hypothetical protein